MSEVSTILEEISTVSAMKPANKNLARKIARLKELLYELEDYSEKTRATNKPEPLRDFDPKDWRRVKL